MQVKHELELLTSYIMRIILICNLVIHTTKNYSIIKVFLLCLFSPNFWTRGFNRNRQNKILELWIKKSLITIVCIDFYYFRIRIMVFNATFNNISVIWWRSALLVEETGVLQKTTNQSQVTDKLHHIDCSTSM
jgi:hypothetical protein